ncbi:unnamed protein product [Rotaria sordida]|uniref:Uncharacterized protein n=1 Tax=Rotaria sordida TaxID=392033 RepID=A0A814V6R2_9BILA|nr:unnamed protein product [Rotaria sordida]CAF1187003.1 unnamed protein product [Rotaria sordida]CAF3795780.1 unnamed protein product [Rotaria sordida]CAF3805521.1 unnamed protein product [Rotaria sordida]
MGNCSFILQSSSEVSSAMQTIDLDNYSLLIDSSQAQLRISALFAVVGKYINSFNGQLQWFHEEEQFEIPKEIRRLHIDLEIYGNDNLCLRE